MNILVVAGGTGGHFYPGLAVAKELIQHGHAVRFIVRDGDYVLPMLEREGVPYDTIPGAGFRREISLDLFKTAFKLSAGIAKTRHLFKKYSFDRVVVMGGYLSVAPAIIARSHGIPVMLHEQNAVPGLANRWLSRLASVVALSFEDANGAFGSKGVVTGNPVRPEFFRLPERDAALKKWGLSPDKQTLLIFGGSLGASALNEAVVALLKKHVSLASQWQVLHFTGPRDEGWARDAYQATPYAAMVDSYCHEMAAAYAASDVVVCRSGASTVAELLVVKKPAIVVPYPFATGDHQTANANVLVRTGAALCLPQKDVDRGGLERPLLPLLWDPSRLDFMTEAARRLSAPRDAAAHMVRLLLALTQPT